MVMAISISALLMCTFTNKSKTGLKRSILTFLCRSSGKAEGMRVDTWKMTSRVEVA